MKRNKLFLLITVTLMIISLSLTACLNSDSASEEEVVKNFLHEFFSINGRGRYDRLMEITTTSASGSTTSEGVSELPVDIQQAYEDYYLPFADTASESCIASMQASRLPVKYDAFFAEYAAKVELDKITLVAVNENSYNFEVLLKADQDLEQMQSPVKGKLTISEVDGQILVDSILISD